MRKETVKKIGRAFETGGLSLVFERGEVPPPVERHEPTSRLGRIAEVFATGGYSLLEKHIKVEQASQELTPGTPPVTPEE